MKKIYEKRVIDYNWKGEPVYEFGFYKGNNIININKTQCYYNNKLYNIKGLFEEGDEFEFKQVENFSSDLKIGQLIKDNRCSYDNKQLYSFIISIDVLEPTDFYDVMKEHLTSDWYLHKIIRFYSNKYQRVMFLTLEEDCTIEESKALKIKLNEIEKLSDNISLSFDNIKEKRIKINKIKNLLKESEDLFNKIENIREDYKDKALLYSMDY